MVTTRVVTDGRVLVESWGNAGNIMQQVVEQAAVVLRAGGIVCIPTESSYGLAVDIRNESALHKLAAIKNRPDGSPFPVIVGDLKQLGSYVGTLPTKVSSLIAAHWPGPLTIVLPTKEKENRLVSSEQGTAFRMSSHPLAERIALCFGGGVTVTSANPSGLAPALDIETAQRYFGDSVSLYVDGGLLVPCLPSTLVRWDGDTFIVLRQGPVEVLSTNGDSSASSRQVKT